MTILAEPPVQPQPPLAKHERMKNTVVVALVSLALALGAVLGLNLAGLGHAANHSHPASRVSNSVPSWQRYAR